jgi:peptidoglycan-associated lipoprotein
MRSTPSKAPLLPSRSALATSIALLLYALLACPNAIAQASAGGSPASVVDRADASVGFNFIRSNAPPGNCHCFNTLGGYGSIGYHLTNWLSLQAELTGQHATNIGTLGQDLTLITYAGGPRLSLPGRRFAPFVQGLFGQARASDSYFPTANGGSVTSANSFALLAGGGLDYNITRHFGVRAINVEFLRTTFPNGSDNSQNHLSLGAGLIVRFGTYGKGVQTCTEDTERCRQQSRPVVSSMHP